MYVKRTIMLIIFMISITALCAFSLKNILNPDNEVSKSNKYLTINEEAEIYTWQWGNRERTYLWCSFPRLNTGNKVNLGQSRDIGDELVNWNINPPGMSVYYLNMLLAVAEFERCFGGWMWVPDGFRITSKSGYKIKKQYGESCHILKKGNLHPANSCVEISGGGESWIGYFLENCQSVRTAFPDEILADALYIKTMNWAVSRNSFTEPWSGDLDNSIMSYADCIVIYTRNSHTFFWGEASDDFTAPNRPVAKHFIFNDDIDYLPVYVEFNEDDLPQEVAIFVNDECRGAQVVEDTLCQICAHILEEELGQDIEFAFWYEGGSREERKSDYLVENSNTGEYEPGNLVTGTPGIHYKVSFKDKQKSNVPAAVKLQCYPNPFNPELTISFNLEEQKEVILDIFNIKGQKVKSLINETYRPENYNVIWKVDNEMGQKVSSGVYFIRLAIDEHVITCKAVLMK